MRKRNLDATAQTTLLIPAMAASASARAPRFSRPAASGSDQGGIIRGANNCAAAASNGEECTGPLFHRKAKFLIDFTACAGI